MRAFFQNPGFFVSVISKYLLHLKGFLPILKFEKYKLSDCGVNNTMNKNKHAFSRVLILPFPENCGKGAI